MNDCTVSLTSNGLYWKASWRDLGGKQHGRSLGPKRKLSRRQAAALCQRMAAEMMIAPSRREGIQAPTLELWLKHYLASRELELGEATLAGHELVCKYLKEYFNPNLRIDRINRNAAAEWRLHLASRSICETTVCGYVRTAKVIFNHAADRDLIPFNPFDRLKGKAPRPDMRSRRYVSRDELQLILDACPNAAWRALFGLCRLAGLRRGEAIGMTWDAVDWAGRRLSVDDTKRGRVRTVPIDPPKITAGPSLYSILLDAWEQAGVGEARVIPRGGMHNLGRDGAMIVKQAGLTPWPKPFQMLRASCDTDMKQVYPEYVVDVLIGHSQQVSRDHYLHMPADVFAVTP